MKRIMLLSLFMSITILPVTANVTFRDSTDFEYSVETDTTETSSSASGAIHRATYTTVHVTVTTESGGSTSTIIDDPIRGYGAIGIETTAVGMRSSPAGMSVS